MGLPNRQQHYLPSFYLAGFTHNGLRDGKLHVFDREQQISWCSKPNKTARQNNFYTLDDDVNGDSMFVEKTLSTLETGWALALKLATQNRVLPTGKQLEDLIVFAAFTAVRTKWFRERCSKRIDGREKERLRHLLAGSPNLSYASFKSALPNLSEQDYEQFKAFAETDDYEISYDNTWHTQRMIATAIWFFEILAERSWAIWFSDGSTPELICSDSPVAFTRLEDGPSPVTPIQLSENTIFSLPLDKRTALVSMIDRQIPSVRINAREVSLINGETMRYANQVFSPSPDFNWQTPIGHAG